MISLSKNLDAACTLGQLNQLDQLLYYDLNTEQAYPQLFSNEDSLFAPDQFYNQNQQTTNNSTKQFEKKDSISQVRPTNLDKMKIKASNSSAGLLKNVQNKVNHQQQIFYQYLNTINVQQIINGQSEQRKSKGNSYFSKNNKNLQSSLECTFKPSILKKSNEIAVSMGPSFERLTMPVRVQNKKLPYKPAIKQLQRQYSKQRIQRLSKPRILKTQSSQTVNYRKIETQKKYFIPKSSNFLNVATRNQVWQQQKQIKIEKLRKQQQENRLKKQASSFTPKLTEYRGDKCANISNFGKQGIANYFERLNMAKSKAYTGKQNNISYRRDSISPYCSSNSKTPQKQNKNGENKKLNQKVKYDDAVKQLHKKLMSLNI